MINMKWDTKDTLLMSIVGIAVFVNIFSITLYSTVFLELVIIGFIILPIGIIFLALSLTAHSKKTTNKIITTGIYGIVRHPMYLGAIIVFVSHIFFSQSWITIISTIIAIICCYLIIQSEDQKNIEKFGPPYQTYIKKVPQINFITGIVRNMQNKKK